MKKSRIAAIDIGSNSPKMMISEAGEDGRPRIIETIRGTLSLGIDTYNQQAVSEERLVRLCELLGGFKEKLTEYKVSDYRVAATSAVREAVNRDFVVARIKQLTGIQCEVLSNSEERYLHNLVLSESFPEFERLAREGTIIVDLGAGSVQVSAFADGKRLMSQNLKLGYLRVSELFSQLQAKASNFALVMNEYIGSQLDSLDISSYKQNRKWTLIAIGNDLDYLRRFAGLADAKENFLPAPAVESAYERLLSTRALDLSLHHGVPSDVSETLLPAAMILHRFVLQSEADGIYMPSVQLSHGLLLELAQEHYDFKPSRDQDADLLSAVRTMALRFGGKKKHLEAMERDALAIVKALGKKFFLNERFALLTRAAVWLSEIGKFVHAVDYPLYSSEIVGHSEFIGLSERETEILSRSIRYLPGNDVPVDRDLEYHSYNHRLTVLQLTAILRLTDALESSRMNKIKDIKASLKKRVLTVRVQTEEDMSLETWAVGERSRLMSELFGIKIVLKVKNPKK